MAELAGRLQSADLSGRKVLVGFDGFVDQVLHVVDRRYDAEHYERVGTLSEYGKKIMDAAGLSLNIEMVPVMEKLGGNGPILANSLMALGAQVTYIGALGKGRPHPVFEKFAEEAGAVSISDPGYTDAIEFYDGKIISSKLENLKEVEWENLKRRIPLQQLAELFEECSLLGFENWSLLMNATGIWRGILQEVVPRMEKKVPKTVFFDLADPEKRTENDIREALECIRKFQDYFQVILGLNIREAMQIVRLSGKVPEGRSSGELAELLQKELGISTVAVHSVRRAAASSAEGTWTVNAPYCEKPVITTGAGDHFNAGFLLGLLTGSSLAESLILGTANSGYYVRNAVSPDREQLAKFLLQVSVGDMTEAI